jgi:hypothetical protein
MHYKDGTEAKLGDIIKHDNGSVGILIGGTVGSDYCSSQVVRFESGGTVYGEPTGPGYIGVLRDDKGKVLARTGVVVSFNSIAQTREHVKIGHVDIGHG